MPFSSLSAPAASVFAPLFALFSSSPTKARLTPSTSSSRLSVLVVEEAPNGGGSGFALPPSSSSTRNDALTRPPSSFTLSSLWKGPTATFTLHDWDSTPEFLRTPFILTSYRVLFPFWLAARSFFLLHNETVNVWTHTVGALYLAYLLLLTQGWSLTEAAGGSAVGWWDRALFFFFHLSALLCFACSTAYHWFGCMSVQAHSCLYIGDMSAIGALILGSCQHTTDTPGVEGRCRSGSVPLPLSRRSLALAPLPLLVQTCPGCTTPSTVDPCFRSSATHVQRAGRSSCGDDD